MQRMLPLTLALGATLSLWAAGGAYALGGMGMSAPSSVQVPPTPGDSPTSGLKVGMTVKDNAGVTVGKITRIGQSGGAPAALVDVDGKTVVVMGSTLQVSGGSATSNQTRDEIKALPEPKPS